MPDLGVLSLNDMVANAGMIASLDRRVPLISDADTGFGAFVYLPKPSINESVVLIECGEDQLW